MTSGETSGEKSRGVGVCGVHKALKDSCPRWKHFAAWPRVIQFCWQNRIQEVSLKYCKGFSWCVLLNGPIFLYVFLYKETFSMGSKAISLFSWCKPLPGLQSVDSLYKEIQSQFTSTFISGIINLVMVEERTSVCFMSCSASLGSQSAVASSAYPEFDKWKKTNGLFGL